MRLAAADGRGRVAGAAQLQGPPDAARGLELAAHLVPHGDVGVRVDVADEVHAVLGAAQQDVDPVGGAEEPDFSLGVAADQRHDDYFGFFSLEVVNGGEAKALDQSFLLGRYP